MVHITVCVYVCVCVCVCVCVWGGVCVCVWNLVVLRHMRLDLIGFATSSIASCLRSRKELFVFAN